jgi:hypothetical protein
VHGFLFSLGFFLNENINNILKQDYQLYCDLRKLEDSSTHERWLTIPEDDDKWEQYAKENGFIGKSLPGKNILIKKPILYLFFFRIFIVNIDISK